MEGFITQMVKALYAEHGDAVSSLEVVLPNRRAQLFFTDALASIAQKPLWQPRYVTVDSLMEEIGGLVTGDRIRLITELYKVYSEYHPDTFDEFYNWGEMLLSDFDSVDKYLIDADVLFANVADLKNLEADISYLSAEQIGVVGRFWKNLDGANSSEKEAFVTVWNTLGPVYHKFRERLAGLGIAYGGMIYRAAAEKIRSGGAVVQEKKKYVIAGFNALSKCEKILFNFLKTNYQTDFFWDYDSYYLDNTDQEAGLFLRDNVKDFPQRLKVPYGFDGFSQKKDITVVSAPSDSLQCKYVAEFLRGVQARLGRPPGKETAIVLTDESLLLSVLHSIPDEVEDINVTMGYPLRSTLAYSFTERLIKLQARSRVAGNSVSFYHSDVLGILRHPYVVGRTTGAMLAAEEIIARQRIYIDRAEITVHCKSLDAVFSNSGGGWEGLAEYLVKVLREFMPAGRRPGDEDEDRQGVSDADQLTEFQLTVIEVVEKLANTLKNCDVEISGRVFASLLRKMLQNVRFPYEGEPLRGVQVMGILETRNLDFDNVLILSADDDNFPGNRAASPSFIPYNLRFGYGLPTPLHHEGVYAYYFYRLLQRASDVHIAYCSHSDEKSSGEQSRYIYQLEYESSHDLRRLTAGVNVNLAPVEPITVEKKDGVADALREYLAEDSPRTISPSSFNRYVACPLRFYFHSIARLSPEKEIEEDVDASMMGTILHYAAEKLYFRLEGVADPRGQLMQLTGSTSVTEAVDEAIRVNYLKDDTPPENYSGSLSLIRDIVVRYLNSRLLPYDAAQAGWRVEKTEDTVGCRFALGDGSGAVRFEGKSDRIDRLEGGDLRIVDYKTGVNRLDFRDTDALFSPAYNDQNPAALQILLYSMMLVRQSGTDTVPALYFIRDLDPQRYSPYLKEKVSGEEITAYSKVNGRFEEKLTETMKEMFDLSVPFRQCADIKHCEYCDFDPICKRR